MDQHERVRRHDTARPHEFLFRGNPPSSDAGAGNSAELRAAGRHLLRTGGEELARATTIRDLGKQAVSENSTSYNRKVMGQGPGQ